MAERGLEPDFSAAALVEASHVIPPDLSHLPGADARDLRKLLWCSIDNDDSQGEDRLAMVAEMTVESHGYITDSSVYPALVKNRAKLAYPSVGAWAIE